MKNSFNNNAKTALLAFLLTVGCKSADAKLRDATAFDEAKAEYAEGMRSQINIDVLAEAQKYDGKVIILHLNPPKDGYGSSIDDYVQHLKSGIKEDFGFDIEVMIDYVGDGNAYIYDRFSFLDNGEFVTTKNGKPIQNENCGVLEKALRQEKKGKSGRQAVATHDQRLILEN